MNINPTSKISQQENCTFQAKKQPSSNESTKSKQFSQDLIDDTVSISDEGRDLLSNKEDYLDELNDKVSYYQELFSQLEDIDNSENPYMDKIKCLQIAIRIISGDKVPMKDEKFLMEHEPEMYFRAILLRRQKEDPKKYKSLINDDKDSNDPLETTVNEQDVSEISADISSDTEESTAE